MEKMKNLNVSCVFLCVIFVNLFFFGNGEIPQTKLCANEACTDPISSAVGLITYTSHIEEGVSFKPKDAIIVFAKGIKKSDLWEVKVGDKRGYVPPTMIRESHVYTKNLVKVERRSKLEESTEPSLVAVANDSATTPTPEMTVDIERAVPEAVPLLFKGVSADSSTDGVVTPPHEVVDGTTLYFSPEGVEMKASPTETVPQATAEVPKPEEEPLDEYVEEDDEEGDDEEDEEDEEEEGSEEGSEEAPSEEKTEGKSEETNATVSADEQTSEEKKSRDPWSALGRPPMETRAREVPSPVDPPPVPISNEPTATPIEPVVNQVQSDASTESPPVPDPKPDAIAPEAVEPLPVTEAPPADPYAVLEEGPPSSPPLFESLNTLPPDDAPSAPSEAVTPALEPMEPVEPATEAPPPSPAETPPETTTELPAEEATTASEPPAEEEPGPGLLGGLLSAIGLGAAEEPAPALADEAPPQTEAVLDELPPPPPSVIETTTESLPPPTPDMLDPEGVCKTVSGLESNCLDAPLPSEGSSWAAWAWIGQQPQGRPGSTQTFLYLVITAVTVLIFTLGHYFIEKSRNDGPLIAKLNLLEQELLVASKESGLLKDELQAAQDKVTRMQNDSDGESGELLTSLREELHESKKQRTELEALVESLQQELDSATEAGLDLNVMLTEVLTQKHGSDSIMQSVEHLQTQLDNQQKIIDDMNASLLSKNQENANLEAELRAANETVETLEQELSEMRDNLDAHLKEKDEVTNELTAQNNQLVGKLEAATAGRAEAVTRLEGTVLELETKLSETADGLALKEDELRVLKEAMKALESKDQGNLDELFNIGHIKAELAKLERDKESLLEDLHEEAGARALLEEHVKAVDLEVSRLRASYEEAERDKVEAQTRLEVLSNYFKEKETQLQKELGLQEAMWMQKQGDETSVYERMKTLQDEIENYKSQSDMLKKEIIDQERGLKGQIATLEKKAHENWVAARQAERKLEESKHEAGQLRNRLTLIEKNITNDSEAKPASGRLGELNGGDALSPIHADTSSPMMFPHLPPDPSLLPPGFMPPPFMPPPPGGFLPPPPFLPGDRRPPPLGRMSSPPLRFSPPPPDYNFDRMSPPPLSPPIRSYRSTNEPDRDRFRHRTPPSPSYPSNASRNWDEGHHSGFRPVSSQRDGRRDHKGSNLSSGHSSSDSLDKSSRHSGKV